MGAGFTFVGNTNVLKLDRDSGWTLYNILKDSGIVYFKTTTFMLCELHLKKNFLAG